MSSGCRRAALVAAGWGCVVGWTGCAQAQSLREAVAQAYRTNPELAAARFRQQAQEELPEQARAAGRLTVDAEASAGYDRLGLGSASLATVAASLPIWTGGRVRSAVRAANGDVAAGAEALRNIEALILERVVAAYANLLYNQQAVQVAKVGIERLDRQLSELRLRFQLGQATRTDVAQLETQRASVVANLAEAEGALSTASAAFRAVVGRDGVDLSDETRSPASLPNSLVEARSRALKSNPLLLQQRRITDAAIARVDQARADRAPRIDLATSYGRGGLIDDGRVRGFAAASAVSVVFRLPLLTGGLVASRVRQASATARAEWFEVAAEEREAERAVDASWAILRAAEGRRVAAVEGLAAADVALRGVRAEYGYGLRTTLDILIADQSYRAAQLSIAAARSDVLVAQAALLRATGDLDADAYEVAGAREPAASSGGTLPSVVPPPTRRDESTSVAPVP